MTAASAIRANREGDPCPPWCQVDHETDVGNGHRYIFHGGETARIDVRGSLNHLHDVIFVRPIRDGFAGGKPQISISGTRHGVDGPGPNAWISPRDAEDLAVITEMLAKATPAQHRQLAAAIREAAAAIADGGQP